MLPAPWLKRIELQTGERTELPLDTREPFVTAQVPGRSQSQPVVAESFRFDGQSWYHHAELTKRWALHGTVAASTSALFVFMEYPEARHRQLEAALATDPGAVSVYADWLEEQGDPYAASLKPELLQERGPAGRWFLEGLDRSGQLTFTLEEALVREARLEAVAPEALETTLHLLVHLRACVALERVVISARSLRGAAGLGSAPTWRAVRWPASMRELVLEDASERTRAAVEKEAHVKVTTRERRR